MVEKNNGNIALGSFIGIIAMLMLAPFSFLGWLAGGVVSGLISRGASRGTLSAFISSLFVLIVIIFLLIISGQSMSSEIYSIFGKGYVYSLINYASSFSSLSVTYMTLRIIIEGIVPAMIGGTIGGSIIRRDPS